MSLISHHSSKIRYIQAFSKIEHANGTKNHLPITIIREIIGKTFIMKELSFAEQEI